MPIAIFLLASHKLKRLITDLKVKCVLHIRQGGDAQLWLICLQMTFLLSL